MNKTYTVTSVLVVYLFIGIAACTDEGTPTDPLVSQLSGSWLWVRSEGGFAYHVIFPPAGTMYIDSYSSSMTVVRSRNDTVLSTARYQISSDKSGKIIRYSDIKSYHGYQDFLFDGWIAFEGDTLRLRDRGADLFVHTFVRQK